MMLPDLSIIRDPIRLSALENYRVLDTPSEPVFDDIVTIACVACDTPIALVSLVEGGRQWFKAASGTALCETPLDQSVCAHAIAQGSMLVIPDLTRDPRTRDNTLVTHDPFIRFYAGALLETATGEVLGTLCVIDTVPRPGGLTPRQVDALQALARQVMSALDARTAIIASETSLASERASLNANRSRTATIEAHLEAKRSEEARAIAAQEAGRIGTFEVDLTNDEMRCSPEMCRILGMPFAPTYPSVQLENSILREDRSEATTMESRRTGKAPLAAEYRIRRYDDGAVRWLSRRAEFTYDVAGVPITFIGTIHDVTERKTTESRQIALVELGDSIRDATSVKEVAETASRILSETLAVSRVGYAVIDFSTDTLRVEKDWARLGSTSIQGVYPLSSFRRTVAELGSGKPLVSDEISKASVLEDDLPAYRAIGAEALIKFPLMRRGALVGMIFVHNSARRAWTKAEVEFTVAIADRTYAAIAKVEAEEQQRFLNQELSHRMKNSFALVQAMASQTLKNSADKEAVAGFRKRLAALSKAHDLLLQQSWASARIREVLETVLSAQVELGRIEFDGPNIVLGPKAVLSLSLLMHELATNAVKHGALTVESGVVRLTWYIDDNTPESMISMTWRERGGPPAFEPKMRGMGSRLIGLGLAGTGDTLMRYEPSGFSAEFRAPLSLLTEN